MVKSDSIAAFDIVLFGFAMVPMLFFGLTDSVMWMVVTMVILVAFRLSLQLMIRKRITPYRKVSPFFRFDQWSYNAIFLSIGGTIAIVFGFDGGLALTAVIGIPVLVVWFVLHRYLYGERRERYDPYTQEIDYGDDDNDVI